MIKKIINGKIYTVITKVNGISHVKTYTAKEYQELLQMTWWEKVKAKYFKNDR